MKANFSKVDKQAREWFVLMQSGAVADAEQQRFNAWLTTDAAHRDAYARCEQIWQDLADLAHTSEAVALKRSVAGIPSEHGLLSWLSQAAEVVSGWCRYLFNPWSGLAYATVVMAVGALFFMSDGPEMAASSYYQTAVAEVRTVALEDGSEIVLGAKSEIRVRLSANERHVELVQGQAFFDVAASVARSFVVDVDGTRVAVVGTRFDVRRGEDRIAVAVEEGVVNVSALLREGQMAGDIGRSEPVVLVAGQKISRISQGSFQPVESIAAASIGAWREGRLVYRGAPLKEVVEDANRYYAGTISLESPGIADIEVTASFRAEQVADLPDLLAGFLPVSIVRKNNHIVILPQAVD